MRAAAAAAAAAAAGHGQPELSRRKSVAPKKSADIHSGPAESRMDVRLNCSGRLDGGEASGLAPCVP
nr:hypothetical protein [Burkholderia pseudomallei]